MAGAADGPPRFWGDLEPGPHAVGFHASWTSDPARTYSRPVLSGEHPRPILVNVWYPARPDAGAPMPHAAYLEPAPGPAELAPLARELSAYAREVATEQIAGSPEEELETATGDRLAELLATPTGAVRGAPREPGPFPLVLYHAGYGSSYEDNAVLCEYLASHGYLVLGSAFLRADGSSLNVDAQEASARDLELLIEEACTEWGADRARVALIGHSGGAHAAIRFVSRTDPPVAAVVSLDTTQDYHSFEDHRWDDMVPRALEHGADIDIPLLFVARQHATFRLADRLTAAPRLYLTFRDLEHDEFIAQGVLAAEFGGRPEAPAIRAGYGELCRAIRLFLDAELKGSDSARAELRDRWAGAEPGLSPVVATHMAAGEGPPQPPADLSRPPTPREFAAMLDAGDAQGAADALREWADDPRAAPLSETEFAIAALFQLVHQGRAPDGALLLACWEPQRLEILRLLRALASYYGSTGAGETAARFTLVADTLDGAADPPP